MRRATTILLVVVLLAWPLAAAAGDQPTRHERHTATITTDDGHHYTVRVVEGESLTVTDSDTGETVCDLDLQELGEQLEEAVSEAMTEAGEALAELKKTALAIHLGNGGNRITVDHDGNVTVVDLDEALSGLRAALHALADADVVRHEETEREDREVAELKTRVQQLQQEIDRLEKELTAVRRRARH